MAIEGLAITSEMEEQKDDVLPGKGGYTLDTGVYPMHIDAAYYDKSAAGATCLKLRLKRADDPTGAIHQQTLWIKSKKDKNYYVTKDGKMIPLPDMAMADKIALIATGKHLGELPDAKKTIKLWDFDLKAETPTEVDSVTELNGTSLMVGLTRLDDNKMALKDGKFVKTAGRRKQNVIQKVFHTNGMTITEKDGGASEATFIDDWKTRFPSTFVDDKYVEIGGGDKDNALPDTTSKAVGSLFTDDDD